MDFTGGDACADLPQCAATKKNAGFQKGSASKAWGVDFVREFREWDLAPVRVDGVNDRTGVVFGEGVMERGDFFEVAD